MAKRRAYAWPFIIVDSQYLFAAIHGDLSPSFSAWFPKDQRNCVSFWIWKFEISFPQWRGKHQSN